MINFKCKRCGKLWIGFEIHNVCNKCQLDIIAKDVKKLLILTTKYVKGKNHGKLIS